MGVGNPLHRRKGGQAHRGGPGLTFIQILFLLIVVSVVVSTALMYFALSSGGADKSHTHSVSGMIGEAGAQGEEGARAKARVVMKSQRSVEHTSGRNATADGPSRGEIPKSTEEGGWGALPLPEIWVEASNKDRAEEAAVALEGEVLRLAGRVPAYDAARDFLYLYQRQGMGSKPVDEMLSRSALGQAVLPGCTSMEKLDAQALGGGVGASQWEGRRLCMGTLPVAEFEKSLESLGLGWPAGRNLRGMAMLRDPLALHASTFFDVRCQIPMWHERYLVSAAKAKGMLRQDEGEQGCNFDLEWIADKRNEEMYRQERHKVGMVPKKKGSWKTDGTRYKGLCASVRGYLSSMEFDLLDSHALSKTVASDALPRPHTALDSATRAERNKVINAAAVRVAAVDALGRMLWFGVAERMRESVCLLFWTLRLPLMGLLPPHTERPCRPLDLWDDGNRADLSKREAVDYIVYKAANDVLDARLSSMRTEAAADMGAVASMSNFEETCLQAEY